MPPLEANRGGGGAECVKEDILFKGSSRAGTYHLIAGRNFRYVNEHKVSEERRELMNPESEDFKSSLIIEWGV